MCIRDSTGATLRQPQAGSRQCARWPHARQRCHLNLHPCRLARGDHGRVRQLAPHPRLGRLGGLGLPLAALGSAYGGGDAQGQEGAGPPSRQQRQRLARGGAAAGWRIGYGQALHRHMVSDRRHRL